MSKKFTERSGMNLYAVNEEVLKEWDEADLFHRSVKVAPRMFSLKDLHRQMDTLVFTT